MLSAPWTIRRETIASIFSGLVPVEPLLTDKVPKLASPVQAKKKRKKAKIRKPKLRRAGRSLRRQRLYVDGRVSLRLQRQSSTDHRSARSIGA